MTLMNKPFDLKNRILAEVDAFVAQFHSQQAIGIFPAEVGSDDDSAFFVFEDVQNDQLDFLILTLNYLVEEIEVEGFGRVVPVVHFDDEVDERRELL